jgi:hypothetical protein
MLTGVRDKVAAMIGRIAKLRLGTPLELSRSPLIVTDDGSSARGWALP